MAFISTLKGEGSPTSKKVVLGLKIFSDYLIFGALEATAQILGGLLPRLQLFNILDPSISFPFVGSGSVVSDTELFVICALVPLLVIVVITFGFTKGSIGRRALVFHYDVIGLVISVSSIQFITELLKFMIGRPRPDFLARCLPDLTKAEAAFTTTAVALFDISLCTQTDVKVLRDGFRSFPSGHSSMSFAGLTYLTLYLSARFRLFVPHSRRGRHFYAFIFAFAPMVLAAWVAATRITDFRHRFVDIGFGAFIGILVPIIVYRFGHPWVDSKQAGIPLAVMDEGPILGEPREYTRAAASPSVHSSAEGGDGLTPNGRGHGMQMEMRSVPQITLTGDEGIAGKRNLEAVNA